MGDNVKSITGDEVVGLTAAELLDDLEGVLDKYAGNITNTEALGALELAKIRVVNNMTDDEVGWDGNAS